MNIAEKAAQHMEELARNDYYGYSQFDRWNHNRDCSSAIIDSYDQAGLNLFDHGARSTWEMIPIMLADGFEDVTGSVDLQTAEGMKRGDVAFKTGHVVMYLGNSLMGEATGDEFGGIGKGAQDGDQTGAEIWITPYRPDFNQVLRYKESEDAIDMEFKTVKPGDRGKDVKAVQAMLKGRGYKGEDGKTLKIDGVYGVKVEGEYANTYYAVCEFQRKNKLVIDGEVGPITYKKLFYR